MTGDRPRDYDKAFTAPVDTRVRRRLGLDVDRGEVKRFVVQLEYRVDAEQDTWVTVVGYDHDAEGSAEATHDVTEDGLHIDIYRDGKKDHLAEHLEGYVRRFEQWHGITPTDR